MMERHRKEVASKPLSVNHRNIILAGVNLLMAVPVIIMMLNQRFDTHETTKTDALVWNDRLFPSPPRPVNPPVDSCFDQVRRRRLPWDGGQTWLSEKRVRSSWAVSTSTVLLVVFSFSMTVHITRLSWSPEQMWKVATQPTPRLDWFVMDSVNISCVVLVVALYCGVSDVWSLFLIVCVQVLQNFFSFLFRIFHTVMHHIHPVQSIVSRYSYFPRAVSLAVPWKADANQATQPLNESGSSHMDLMAVMHYFLRYIIVGEVASFAVVWTVIVFQYLFNTLDVFYCVNGRSLAGFDLVPIFLFITEIAIMAFKFAYRLEMYRMLRLTSETFGREDLDHDLFDIAMKLALLIFFLIHASVY